MHHHYEKIAEAITFIRDNFKKQPSLDEIAASVNVSPFHFQRMFTEWSGISPKQYLRFLTISYAKQVLETKRATLFDTAIEAGLSGTGRLHDLFVKIEGMTPAEFREGGKALNIKYHFWNTPFGEAIAGSTSKGLCYMAFSDEKNDAIAEMHKQFPHASYSFEPGPFQKAALKIFETPAGSVSEIKLHVKGTPFQIKVWEALLKIPPGSLSTYSSIATSIGHLKASRAVGSAVGDNPIAYLIPCHRVIRSSGESGQYHWGSTRKAAMIGWEAALHEKKDDV